MPIYEYYCKRCNTVYQFFARTVNVEKIPKCPRCKRPKLERIMSGFATISGAKDQGDLEMNMPDIDESKMEKAMSMLERKMDKLDEDDPRQAASLMRELTNATGLEMGDNMEEALSRLEKGEDPEKIEREMGDLLEGEGQLFKKTRKGKKQSTRKSRPNYDDTLYELE